MLILSIVGVCLDMQNLTTETVKTGVWHICLFEWDIYKENRICHVPALNKLSGDKAGRLMLRMLKEKESKLQNSN